MYKLYTHSCYLKFPQTIIIISQTLFIHWSMIIITDSPSSPVNLHYTLTPTITGSVAVRLDWDPPLNDGGEAITNYLIFVNMSQQVVSTDTTTTLTLNSTGQHLVEISAVNSCGLSGANFSRIINTTGKAKQN